MRTRLALALCVLGLAFTSAAQASTRAAARVRAVYRTVLTAEYFGPASGVCAHLTAAAVRSFTAGGMGTCRRAFAETQHTLRRKAKNVDNAGYTPTQWHQVVETAMANLRVRVHGTRATAVGGQAGIPGRTKLVDIGGRWLLDSYPPSVGP